MNAITIKGFPSPLFSYELNMLPIKPALYTDLYELTMAQGYFLSGKHQQEAVFDYFFRSLPFEGGFVIFAGLGDLLSILERFQFHQDELDYLKSKGFQDEFLRYLEDFRFQGVIRSVKEGEIVFPNEPVLQVEGSILESQLLETLILNLINFESLIATKAARIKLATDKTVMDFGLRRAQGTGGMQAAKAAVIGGASGTSNVAAGHKYNLEISGTMAHSWVQFFEDELTAFRTYADHYTDSTVLLVDTYDTLKSGVPNAITVAKELESKGHKLLGVRLDSGDLAYLSRKTRQFLDEADLQYVKIVASNSLDEHIIKSLSEQAAPIDIFGVGTRLVTAHDDPALDGVYKLSSVGGQPTLKLSENITKTTLPGKKRVFRFYNEDGTFNSDGICLQDEKTFEEIHHPYQPITAKNMQGLQREELLQVVFENGLPAVSIPTAQESAVYAKQRLELLNPEHKRFDNPHVYKVGISGNLLELRNKLMSNYK